jgi:redox-sensing transcriptional repressor
VRRLSSYYRILDRLAREGVGTVSSSRLAELGGVTPAQVRKDLSFFGNFGKRGLGYPVGELRGAIQRILGLDRRWAMALFGAGSLGHALFFHRGFREDGFHFKAIFDVDPDKIGERWGNVRIRPIAEARRVLKRSPVDIGVIATPADAAQDIADLLVDVGVRALLNFAPRELQVPEGVRLRNVNLAMALESLSYFLSKG